MTLLLPSNLQTSETWESITIFSIYNALPYFNMWNEIEYYLDAIQATKNAKVEILYKINNL